MPDILIAVLAGGRSRRMGAPKPTTMLGGRPLIDWPVQAALATGHETVVVARVESALPPDLAVPVWIEEPDDRHALNGIVAALRRANGRDVVALACDLPFVTADLLAWIANQAGCAVTRCDGRIQPLLARYPASCAGALAAARDACESATAAAAALDPVVLDEAQLERFGAPERLLFNVNTLADLRTAEQFLEQ